MTNVERANGTSAELVYDGAGQVTEVRNLDVKGKEISRYAYTYDLSGFILMEEITTEEGTNSYQLFKEVEESPKTSTQGEEGSIFWYGFGQSFIQALTVAKDTMGKVWMDTWEELVSAYHRKVIKDRANEEGIVVNPDGITDMPGEGEVTYPGETGKALIPYKVVTDTYDYFEVRNYVNDINQTYTQVLEAYDETGEVRELYTYGNERLDYSDGEDIYYYGYTGTGSVAQLTDQSGDTVSLYDYDVFGAVSTTGAVDTGNPYTYNGEYTDAATGEQYLRARYYDAQTGSFLTQDSYLGNLMEPLTANLYTYAENNPVNFDDPSGHGIFSWAKSKISSGINKVKKTVSNAVNKVKTTVSNVVNKARTTVSNVVNKAKNVINNTANKAKTAISNTVNKAKNWASNIVRSSGGGKGNSYSSNSSSQSLYEKAKSAGKSLFNWGSSKLKEAKNIATSWSESLEKTVKRFCTSAERAVSDLKDSLLKDKIPNGLKALANFYSAMPAEAKGTIEGFSDLFNVVGTKNLGKLINYVTDNNDVEAALFDKVKVPVGKLLAFEYDEGKGYYKTNETYGIQRNGGFMDLFDEVDGLLGMDLDTKVINYSYGGVNYRLQLWKGSYGFGNAFGGEIGLYSNTDGGEWYQCVSGQDEIQTKQYIRNKETGDELLMNDTALYATNGDHFWNLAIKTDSGWRKENLVQESYLMIDDKGKRSALLKELSNVEGISFSELNDGRIKITF